MRDSSPTALLSLQKTKKQRKAVMDITIALGSIIFSVIRLLSALWWILPIALVGYWIYLGAETYRDNIVRSELGKSNDTNIIN